MAAEDLVNGVGLPKVKTVGNLKSFQNVRPKRIKLLRCRTGEIRVDEGRQLGIVFTDIALVITTAYNHFCLFGVVGVARSASNMKHRRERVDTPWLRIIPAATPPAQRPTLPFAGYLVGFDDQ